MPLLVLFVMLPLLEIALFILVGGAIGLWPTLLIVILTAVLGVWLMRRQGARAARDVQSAFTELRDPSGSLAHGALIVMAGGLLVLPGFFTDSLGALLLLPPVRSWLIRRMGRRVRVVGGRHTEAHRYGGGAVIDGDYLDETVIDQAAEPPIPDRPLGPRRPSGWTADPH
ncbi:FxsA family protein [Paracoccus sp. S-4012]|uniref:FxsA family protein n=1 Tax=Paracoccus sp. S-4012 TaxID=2665648 RepID=UPI0012AF892B|nr:FxsA family protein [Paracoccus sp. S-4012]MRX49828.1 FxsA family protein [Paracoccus sp. S-4012]